MDIGKVHREGVAGGWAVGDQGLGFEVSESPWDVGGPYRDAIVPQLYFERLTYCLCSSCRVVTLGRPLVARQHAHGPQPPHVFPEYSFLVGFWLGLRD